MKGTQKSDSCFESNYLKEVFESTDILLTERQPKNMFKLPKNAAYYSEQITNQNKKGV